MTNAWLTCSRLRSRHFEVVGEREKGRARGRQATHAVSFTIDKSIRKNQKQRNIQRFFNATASVNLSDYNYYTYFYLISVFLHTVLYFIKKWFIVTNFTLPWLFRNPAISNFFPFPLGLRNSGVQLYFAKKSKNDGAIYMKKHAIYGWDSFPFYMRTVHSRTGTKITLVGSVTEMKSDRSEFIFRPAQSKCIKRNVWRLIQTQTGLSSSQSHVNTP